MIKIIASGSDGNAVIYHKQILVDIGVAFYLVEPFLADIRYILLTHQHKDHINISTLTRALKLYPDIEVIGCEWFEDEVDGLNVIQSNTWYQLDGYQISAFDVFHDKPNVGYRIFKQLPDFEWHKTLHFTDGYSLDGVEAVGYDLYAVEHNHCEVVIDKAIETKQTAGEYAYEINARENHMSEQRIAVWLSKNNINDGIVIPLHISEKNGTAERKEDVLLLHTQRKKQIS